MNDVLKREWGAVLFVATVIVGALAVAVALFISAGHHNAVISNQSCPSYTPYVVNPVAQAPGGLPSATPFDVGTANCPTAPLPPTAQSTPTLPPLPAGAVPASPSP